MWPYIFRRLAFNVPVFFGIVLLVMGALRATGDPIPGFLGKNATKERYEAMAKATGLDRPFLVQYAQFVGNIVTLNFQTESWDQPGVTVGELLGRAIGPSLAITVPELALTTLASLCVGLISAYNRGRFIDRSLVILMVLGTSISFLVYIIFGQYFGAFVLYKRLGAEVFAIDGYEPGVRNWAHFCLLPVIISVIVAMGFDTRFYRSVMVEETGRDYITTARAKGATKTKIMFVHMLKNAMIQIITWVSMSLPFLITGSILLEVHFGIPGMGRALILAVNARDFPVIQTFTAVFAALYIVINILTDVVYALFDPRVRLS